MKTTTTKVQEWTTTDKSQKCNTTTESQEWLVITREINQEAWEKLTKQMKCHPLRRPQQKKSGISQKGLVY